MKIKVLSVVTYPARDLEGHVLIGYYLEKLFGWEVIYTNAYSIPKKLLEHAPDILILDHLTWDFKAEELKFAKSLGIKVAILPTEGFIYEKEVILRNAGVDHKLTYLVDLYFMWGNYQKNIIAESNIIDQNKIKIVGSARFDYYCDPIIKNSLSRDQFIKLHNLPNKNGPIILWTTNTPYLTRSKKKIISRYIKRSNWDKQHIENLLTDSKIQFEYSRNIVSSLAKKHPEWNFIIKIHPAEWATPYRDLEKQHPNIKIAANQPIKNYIINADFVFQRNCTTATEAWIAEKPVLQLDSDQFIFKPTNWFVHGNFIVKNVKDAEDVIMNNLGDKKNLLHKTSFQQDFINMFYYKVDGNSAIRIVKELVNLMNENNHTVENKQSKNKLINEIISKKHKDNAGNFIVILKKMIGINQNFSVRFWKNWFSNETRDENHIGEKETTREMVSPYYEFFDQINLLEFKADVLADELKTNRL